MIAACVDCGSHFPRESDEDWKVRCFPCWARRKNQQQATTWPSVSQQTHRRVRELEADVAEWRAQAERLSCENFDLRELLELIGDALDSSFLRRALQCCHPDKNQSPLAGEVTAWLLDLREIGKEATRH
jgi:hypothetical protein